MLPGLSLPSCLADVLGAFACCFTAPTFSLFCALVVGQVTQTGRRTICGLILGAGLSTLVRHERFHRFFSRARWCPDQLGLALARLVVAHLVAPGAPLTLATDDSLFERWGRRVFGVFWTHDGSVQGGKGLSRGNRWVVLGLVVSLPFLSSPVCLPVLARLWGGKGSATPVELAAELVELVAAAFPDHRLHVVGDAAYHSPRLRTLPAQVTWSCRLARNAVCHDLAPARTGKRGRPRTKGDRLGTATELAAAASWALAEVRAYGETTTMALAEVRCLWYSVFGTGPIRVVLAKAHGSDRPYDLAIVTTDLDCAAAEVVQRYAARWSVEVLFFTLRRILGAGQVRNRLQLAVERTLPFQLVTYGVVLVWYARYAHAPATVAARRALSPWYRTKVEPSYEDMLAALRLTLAEARFSGIQQAQSARREKAQARQAREECLACEGEYGQT